MLKKGLLNNVTAKSYNTYLRISSLDCTESSEYGQDVTKTKIVVHLKSTGRSSVKSLLTIFPDESSLFHENILHFIFCTAI